MGGGDFGNRAHDETPRSAPTLLCPELVGRDAEVASLRQRLSGLGTGVGGVVALVGDAGAGKSRLLGDLADAARAAGLTTMSGRAVPGPNPVPYRPLTEAFLAAFRSAPPPEDPSLVGFGSHLARLVPSWTEDRPSGTDDSPVLLAEAIVRLLTIVGGEAGVVLLLEDVHWADPETIAVLDYLADALREVPVLCVWTARPDGVSDDLLHRLVRRDATAVIPVSPLDDVDLDRMLVACLAGGEPPPGLGAFLRSHSDGNPFLVEELLAGLVASGELIFDGRRWTTAGSLTPTVPASLRESIRRRLGGLADPSRQVLGSAALLGRSFEWELLPGIADVDARAAADCLRAAVDGQLIDVEGSGFTFRHALTREAVLADLLPPERQDLAARAWPAVERANPGLPGAACELAAELAEAAGEAGAAAERLVESARRALRAGALVTAETAARRAKDLAEGDPAISLDAHETLVHVLVAAGKPGDALAIGRPLVDRMRQRGEPSARQVDLLVTTARAALTAGDLPAAASDVDAARRAAESEDDPAFAARVDAVAAQVALDRADLVEAERLGNRAVDGASATGQAEVECEALLTLGRAARAGGPQQAEPWFQRAEEVAGRHGLASWHLRARQELALTTAAHGERRALRETRDLATRYGALITVAVMDLGLADLALAEFDKDECLATASACAEASRRYGLATEAVANLWLAGAHALHADEPGMREAIDLALAPDPTDPRILGDLYGRVLVAHALVTDRLDELPGLLDTMMEHVRRAPPTTSVFPGRTLWALLHTVDDPDLGVDARAEFSDATDRVGLSVFQRSREVIEAVALGRQGEAEEASDRFEAAQKSILAVPLGRAYGHISTLIVSRAALRDGWGDPVRWLREAEAFFAAGDYHLLVRRCRAMLGDAGVPIPRRGRGNSEVPQALRALGVTSREVDVLSLVVDGLTNKEVAGELFLSTKTVERHLSSLFDRLGVRDRRALAARVRELSGDVDP